MASIHIQMCSSQYLCSRRCAHASTVHQNVNQLSSSNNSLRKTWISRRPLLLMSSMSTSIIHGHGHDPLRLPVPALGKRNCSSYSRDHSNSACDHAEEEPAANAEETLDPPPPEKIDRDLEDSDDYLNLRHEIKDCIDSLWVGLKTLESVEADLCNLTQGLVSVYGKLNTSYARDDDKSNKYCGEEKDVDPALRPYFVPRARLYEIPEPEELPVIYREGIKRQWKNLAFFFRSARGHLGLLNESLEHLNKRRQALKCTEPKSNDFENLQSMEEDCKNMKNLSHALNYFAADLKRLDANLKELFEEELERTRKL